MRPRLLILPIAAGVIAALVAWKGTRTYVPASLPDGRLPVWTPAPDFEAIDENNRPVRLKSFLGRHRLLVAFYDGDAGADRDPVLLRLRERFTQLQAEDVKVFGVSRARPVQNREAAARVGGFPFPLLSDVEGADVPMDAHRRWSRIDPETHAVRPGLFLVDRAGRVDWESRAPRPLADPLSTIDRLSTGK